MMVHLPKILRKNAFTYTLELRGTRSLIYRQHVNPEVFYFEVFVIKVKPAQEILGRFYPDREVFPGNEDFGVIAWSYRNYNDALKKYNYLEKSTE